MPSVEELLAENNNLLRQAISRNSTPGPAPASTGITALNTSAGLAGKAVEGLSGAFGAAKGIVGESLDAYREFSKFGVNFNNDAIGFRASIAGTRLSVQEYSQTLSTLIPNITALGGTITDGTKNFNRLSKEFSDTTAADELRKIGYTTKEYNDVLAISVAGRKNIDFNDAESRKKANMAAADLALEMDKVAQLTGVSRQEQQKALQEKQGNARVQATIEQQIRAGGKDAADAYMKMSTQMKGIGLDKLADEIYSGQALSQKSISQLNALGPAGNQLRDAINQVRNATDDESRARANAALREAQAAVARQVTSDQSLNQIRYGQGETAEALGEISISARNYANAIEKTKEEARRQGREISDAEAAQALEKRGRFAQDLASGRAEADARKAVEEAKTDTEKKAAEQKLREVQQAKQAAQPTEVLIQVLNRLNDTMSAMVIGADKTVKGLTVAGSAGDKILKTTDAFTKNVQTIDGKTTSAIDRGGVVNIPNFSEITNAISKGDWIGAGRKVAEGFQSALTNYGKTLGVEMPTTSSAAPRANFGQPPVSRAGGSPNVDNIVEDFGAGTPAILHEKEAVMTLPQIKGLVSNIWKSAKSETINQNTLTSESITGGGETTTKRVQSDDSKSAQAEMDALSQKFGTDWQKRKEVLIEGMAVEDRKFSKVQAAMRADVEAQKIKEDYEAKKAEIQKRIDDGIKYEVETKKSASDALTEIVKETGLKELDIKQINSDKISETVKAETEKESALKSSVTETLSLAIEKVKTAKPEQPKPKGFDDNIEALQKELVAKGANIKIDGLLGPLTKNAMSQFGNIKVPDTNQVKSISRSIPNEVAQSKAEAMKRTVVTEPVVKKEEPSNPLQASTNLDDLKDQLIQLNKTMGEMLSYSSEMVGGIEKQIRATKRMDPNVSLRG